MRFKTQHWFKKSWHDKGFRMSFWAIAILGALLTIGISVVDGYFAWEYFAAFCGFDIFVMIPMAYLFRNNP